MSSSKKLLQAAAGSAGGAGLNVEEVFTNWLYTGDDSTTGQTIQNGVDYTDGEERLVWIKARNDAKQSVLVDTVRGANKNLSTANTTAEDTEDTLSAFTSNGFTVKHTTTGDYAYTVNRGSSPSGATTYVSWTFRKAPKFFDVVTYTGDGTSNRSISHDLNSNVGTIIVKSTSNVTNWMVWHKDLTTNYLLTLNSTAAQADYSTVTIHDVTSTSFQVDNYSMLNASGVTYVAYLFAHNDGDGDFGPTGDQDIIKCGTYSINAADHVEDLGFEPQWVMTKSTNIAGSWIMVDNMRGMGVDRVANQDQVLRAQITNAEQTNNGPVITPTGFVWPYDGGNAATNGEQGIYIAIRRGPMAVPESATDVFDVEYSNQNGDGYYANLGAVTDTWLYRVKNTTSNWILRSRLTGANYLHTNLTSAETSQSFSAWDNMNGVGPTGVTAATNTNEYNWVWKRAPNFFDVVAYAGAGAAQTINHNLGVAPEMIWVKVRDFATSWTVFHKDLGIDKWLNLDNTNTVQTASGLWGTSDPDATTFGLGLNTGLNNGSGRNYIAYLFASLDGISKVGSYTGNGSITGPSIDCGFSAGPRFVLIKRTDSAENWYLFDSERGIVAGTDPYLMLNSTSAEINAGDIIDPTSSGFQLATNSSSVNASGGTYIFYAIA